MKSITRFVVPLTFALMPAVAAAASISVGVGSNGSWFLGIGSGSGSYGGIGCGASNICYVAATILFIINDVLVPLLFAVAFIVFLYGVAKKYILSQGDEEGVAEGHRLILWGIIGFVVMVSLWGLVNVVANTFGLTGSTAPVLPTSY
jgi:hypothetical protein